MISDIGAAIGLWRLCVSLAVLDIKLRYRGSVLGHIPTLSVCVAAVIYAALITAAAFWLFARARGRLAFWV